MRIPGTAPDLPRFRRSEAKPDIRLPAVAVLMGPNGSGKTTLLRALNTVAQIIVATDGRLLATILPFSAESSLHKPTTFCMDFEAAWLDEDKARELFRYEILIKHDAQNPKNREICYEALFHFPKGRKRRLFERGEPGTTPIYVSDEFGIKPSDDRLKAIHPGVSVIAMLAFLNVPLATRINRGVDEFLRVSNILPGHDQGWEYPTQDIMSMIEQHPKLEEWIKQTIQRSDLAIHDFYIRDIMKGGPKQVFFKHYGLDPDIPLPLESRGTKRFFHLLPKVYHTLDRGLPAVLDEVDGDLHIDLFGEILQWFRAQETNPNNAQIIVTSHNVGLLDDLEKEELFIVEKGRDSATRVHGAQDVRGLRRDVYLYSKYRAGMLGGIPRIG